MIFHDFSRHLRGEADQARTDAQSSTLARRGANRGAEDVQHREHGRRRDRHREDLIQREALPGNKHERQRHRHALNNVLNHARQKIINVHLIYIRSTDFLAGREIYMLIWSKGKYDNHNQNVKGCT